MYIPLHKLFLLNFFTLNLYELFWFYKNWQALSAWDGKKRNPFLRAIFSIFYCHGLFKIILEKSKKLGYKTVYSAWFLATVYICLMFGKNILNKYGETNHIPIIFYFLAYAFCSLLLLIPQAAVNYYKEKDGQALVKSFGKWEKVLLGVGVLFFVLSWVGLGL